MSTKFETPANDGQSNHSSGDDVVNLKLFSCAFDTPPVSSNNDSSSPTNGPGNLFRLSDWASPKSTLATTGGVVDRVMNSLGNMQPQSSDLGGILPKVLIEGNKSPQDSCAIPNLSELLNGNSSDGGSALKPKKPILDDVGLGSIIDNVVPKPQSKPHENGSGLGSIIDNVVPKPQSKPHENGSGLGSIIDNVVPKPQTKPHENSSGLGSIIDNVVPKPQTKPHENSSGLGSIIDNVVPKPQSKPHENGSGLGSIIDNVVPKPQTKPHENGSGLGSIIDNVVPKPQTKPHENGSGLGSIIDNVVPKPQTKPREGSGNDKSSAPPHGRTPIENSPPNDKSDRSSLPSHGRTPIENTPPSDKTDRSPFPSDGRSPIENKDRIKQPIDRSPKFKYPEDKPLDAKQADEMADKLSKWIKESVDKDGNLNLDQNTLDRLKDALQYGISHGEKGLQEMIAKINKKLEGSGIEIKSDGKAFAHFQTCMPDIERGDHLGDFIGFDVMKNGKKVDSNLVKVGSGIFDRLR